jgi:hypothetical protein
MKSHGHGDTRLTDENVSHRITREPTLSRARHSRRNTAPCRLGSDPIAIDSMGASVSAGWPTVVHAAKDASVSLFGQRSLASSALDSLHPYRWPIEVWVHEEERDGRAGIREGSEHQDARVRVQSRAFSVFLWPDRDAVVRSMTRPPHRHRPSRCGPTDGRSWSCPRAGRSGR